MRTGLTLTALTLIALPLAAQADADKKAEGGGTLPPGWNAKLDKATASLADVKFAAMGTGWHFTTGPAVIVWRDADNMGGPFHAVASFTQTKAPTHPEAFGLFIAGKDLKGTGTSYTYFIVRGDGKFLVKKMSGTTATNVSEGWTANDAITMQDATGKQTNRIEVSVGKDGKVSWMVNGKAVYSMTAAPGDLTGIVGLRVNHNLDVHVEGFGVHKM